MPIYPFACDACGAEFEVTRKLSAMRDPAACPACGADARRVFTGLTVTGKAEAPGPAAKKPAPGGWSHSGHSHGAGTDAHTHGIWGR
jgi:putative FmdB family regulatory protein